MSPLSPTRSPRNDRRYQRASWFPQQQQIAPYQPLANFQCTVATYNIDSHSKIPFFSGTVVSVYNYCNVDKVNGAPNGWFNDSGTVLCANVADNAKPAELAVAPCFLPALVSGPYWVVDAGPSPAHYEWAIISGGQPTEQYSDGCTTSETKTNGSGLWLFTRARVADPVLINMMRGRLTALGYTLQRLHPMQQAGCEYAGAFIKLP